MYDKKNYIHDENFDDDDNNKNSDKKYVLPSG